VFFHVDLRDVASVKRAGQDAHFSQILFCGNSHTHPAAIRNLCMMTAVLSRNLAAATAKLNRILLLLASNFPLFPLSLPCHRFLLEPFLFHFSWLFLLLFPPVWFWLVCPFAKAGTAEVPLHSSCQNQPIQCLVYQRSREDRSRPRSQAPAAASGLQRRRCPAPHALCSAPACCLLYHGPVPQGQHCQATPSLLFAGAVSLRFLHTRWSCPAVFLQEQWGFAPLLGSPAWFVLLIPPGFAGVSGQRPPPYSAPFLSQGFSARFVGVFLLDWASSPAKGSCRPLPSQQEVGLALEAAAAPHDALGWSVSRGYGWSFAETLKINPNAAEKGQISQFLPDGERQEGQRLAAPRTPGAAAGPLRVAVLRGAGSRRGPAPRLHRDAGGARMGGAGSRAITGALTKELSSGVSVV